MGSGAVKGDGARETTRGLERQLQPLIQKSTYSRLIYGETLLAMAEANSQNAAEVARHMRAPKSTLRPRVRWLKKRYSASLRDERWRAQVVAVLSLLVPVWREEVERRRR